jgi:sugar (pentulose or hexulose) kinase
MGWAERFPPLRTAGEALGPITAEWAARTGLPRDTQIHCGIHDSNAALQAARQFPEIRGREATILSTGTWFIAMRSPEAGAASPPLAEERDCLFNVDIHGRPIPSARFMGGREVEILGHLSEDRKALDALLRVVENRAMVLPTFAAGVGPFPQNVGLWLNKPEDDAARQVAIYLYAAMVANVSLNLIGAAGRILIEGRFARCETFVRALATLRPRDAIYTTDAGIDVSFGALCLLNEALQPPSPLLRVQPFDVDLTDYHADWSTHL